MLSKILNPAFTAFLFMAVCVVPDAQSADFEMIDLNSHFPMAVPATRNEMESKARETRNRIRLATGIWPMPELADPSPTIHSRREMKGYSVEKIYFESLPGYYVTGNLYRPLETSGPAAAVLCPHGHWREGRFYDAGISLGRKHLASGAERYMAAARNHIQARCVQIARMGCVALQWDMAGYADSDQISMERIHGFRKQDSETETSSKGWLLYSALAESHLQSAMGLQTIGALQAVRVVQNLPGVDRNRIAMTGASGGGTQTFITAAIDNSIAAAFPAVMVSTGMQGGCTCENACYLRCGVGNIDIAACIAPRPLGLTAANDWTKTMPTDGYPELRQVYELMGAQKQLQFTPLIHFDHNYNHVSRVAFYRFLNQSFGLGFEQPILESDFQRLDPDELTVWNDQHPAPKGGTDFERQLLIDWQASTQKQLARALDASKSDKGAKFHEIVGTAIRTIVGEDVHSIGIPEFQLESKIQSNDRLVMRGTLSVANRRDISTYYCYPKDWNGVVRIALHPEGIAGLEKLMEDASSTLAQAVDQGACVAGLDMIGQDAGSVLESQPLVREDRLAACFTYGYNPPILIRRVHDVIAMANHVKGHNRTPNRVELIAIGSTCPIVAVAGAVLEDKVDLCELDSGAFRFEDVPSIDHLNFLPGGARYYDMPGILALHAPRPLRLHDGFESDFHVTKTIYENADASKDLMIVP